MTWGNGILSQPAHWLGSGPWQPCARCDGRAAVEDLPGPTTRAWWALTAPRWLRAGGTLALGVFDAGCFLQGYFFLS